MILIKIVGLLEQCNNVSYYYCIDVMEDKNEVSPYDVFIYWKNDSVLWSAGYYRELSEEAIATFRRYVVIDKFEEDTGDELYPDILDIKTGKYLSKVLKPVYVINKEEW